MVHVFKRNIFLYTFSFSFSFVSGSVNSAMSMPNLSVDRSQPTKTDIAYMPTLGETKKKKGFFSFLKKDNSKKFSLVSIMSIRI